MIFIFYFIYFNLQRENNVNVQVVVAVIHIILLDGKLNNLLSEIFVTHIVI